MNIFESKEVLFDGSGGIESGVEVVDRIEGNKVYFRSGKSMNLNEVKKHAKDPINTLIDQDKVSNTQTKRSTRNAIGSKKKKKRRNPHGNEEYGGLKKVGSGNSGKGKGNPEADDAIDDGMPHRSSGKVKKLNEEVDKLSKQNKRKRRKIKQQSKKNGPAKNVDKQQITQGLDEVDTPSGNNAPRNANPSNNSPANPNAGLQAEKPQPSSKLRSLLKESDNYQWVEFNVPVSVKLPPKEALKHLGEYFDIDLEDELRDLVTEKLFELINNEESEFDELLKNQIIRYLQTDSSDNQSDK